MQREKTFRQAILISFLLSIACTAPSLFAQNRDSLIGIWENTTHPDSQRLQAARDLVRLVRPNNPDSSLQIADAMLAFARERGYPVWMLKAYASKGISYAYLGNYPKALDNFERSKTLAEEIGDPRQLLGSIVNVGNIYYNQGDYYSALANYEQSLLLAEELRDTALVMPITSRG